MAKYYIETMKDVLATTLLFWLSSENCFAYIWVCVIQKMFQTNFFINKWIILQRYIISETD